MLYPNINMSHCTFIHVENFTKNQRYLNWFWNINHFDFLWLGEASLKLFVIFIWLSFLILSNFIYAKNEMKFFLLGSILRKYPVKQECHEGKTPLMLPIFLMIPFEEKSSEAPKTSHKQTKTGVSDVQTSEVNCGQYVM